MSYILDALKKSEQQRQAVQPGSVTDRLLINQPDVRPKSRKWWLILIFGNLAAIAGMVWYLAKLDGPPGQRAAIVSAAQKAESAQPVQTASPPVPVSQAPEFQVNQTALSAAPSIAEMIEPEQPEPAAIRTEPRLAKANAEKKATVIKKRPVLAHRDEAYTVRPEESYAEEQPVAAPAPNFIPSNPAPAWTPSVNPDPVKPKLAINVFGYTENPKDRFVIINMTKYKIGQRISGDLVLKSIHPDHIELQQGNVSIKMDRP